MVASDGQPFFSVLITVYNRPREIVRCLHSCRAQTFGDFETVVVDDASTDTTLAVLAEMADPRLRVVRHERNQGTSPARATAVDHARGEWLVMVDSDDELLPEALARLRELIAEAPPGVRIIRFRHRLDDGRVVPETMPPGVIDYEGRLAWLEAISVTPVNTDAGHCMHRSVFARRNYIRDRRGAVEALWELNLAREERSWWVPDVLGLVHADAPNRYSRESDAAAQINRLRREAPDQLWMAEEMLAEHGLELARAAPHYRRWLLESAAREALLVGDRRRGARHTWAAAQAGSSRPKLAATLVLGLGGPRALAAAKVLGRRWRARRLERSGDRGRVR